MKLVLTSITNALKKRLRKSLRKSRSRAGFTLLETLISISIIALVITAAAELTRSSIKIGSVTMNQFLAFHQAEEGLEITRTIRDSNWLRNRRWDEGLAAGSYRIVPDEEAGSHLPWKLSDDLFEPADEEFHRIVTISYAEEPNGTNVMNIVSTVSYNERGKDKQVTLQTELTDWKQGPI
ncbi:hypothetical protein CO046_04455 [Candidatus Peregrinibacteria bacterium CG_4_9_14_0_2_um_filter_53_11]|nr:MAG: hypothetical protein CO046_04455 [Candidatus Peregrinibacteria bacterium CG_4_9_14_0_2_um_filter_53_11]